MRLCIRDRKMTHPLVGPPEFSQLKMEALIPAPADCEKVLNAQSIVTIEIQRQLCQVYGHTRLEGQHIFCRSSSRRCLNIIHPIAWTSRPVISIFSYTFIEQFRARWPWSIGVLESWLSKSSSSSEVPASSILSIPSPRRFVPGCGRHSQEWSL